jgi:hypothetical protein
MDCGFRIISDPEHRAVRPDIMFGSTLINLGMIGAVLTPVSTRRSVRFRHEKATGAETEMRGKEEKYNEINTNMGKIIME